MQVRAVVSVRRPRERLAPEPDPEGAPELWPVGLSDAAWIVVCLLGARLLMLWG